MNASITCNVLQSALNCGVTEFVVCPAGRNASFIEVLRCKQRIKTYYWPEERSAAFFALGLSRRKRRPVAVIVTSGTAAGELLPAAMEAYYSGVPLLLITADRPLRFRGSGAPQTAEQVNLFGPYVQFCVDIDDHQGCDLSKWTQQLPAHINVCLEEPQGELAYSGKPLEMNTVQLQTHKRQFDQNQIANIIDHFLSQIERPLVIVSTLPNHAKAQVTELLLKLNAPVYLEGVSGLRENPSLQVLRIKNTESMLEFAESSDYAIDGVLRIGGIPTNRIWRDIENLNNKIKVCSLSELSFSGLSWNSNVGCADIEKFLQKYQPIRSFDLKNAEEWLKNDDKFFKKLQDLYKEEPLAEPSLIHALANAMPKNSHVYLGNSLPIREWDLSAGIQERGLQVTASRGLNGIDGQIATFLGLCQSDRDNWAILGDLTTLYDMAGFWALPFVEAPNVSVAVINNGGGKIFERMFFHPEMLNSHGLSFEPLAKMWGLSYECWGNGLKALENAKRQLIEIIPDDASTKRFWDKMGCMKQAHLACARSQIESVF
ncbi:MAG: 2-succinyl-5-enolpyruvyl-6-hydroxy-3-cyclohexene-1-carboxylic-acid synthase [Parachlamydiaceae bacterium]|nr:2-succinyl-5-enolpyruvyl-6-hydroxy-3-cyclohexene-1-carboxylic-acid synthase [Parachlamydiaceae bacterium]